MEELQGLKTGDGHMDCFVMSMLVCIGKGNASESLLSQRVHDASRVALRCQRKVHACGLNGRKKTTNFTCIPD